MERAVLLPLPVAGRSAPPGRRSSAEPEQPRRLAPAGAAARPGMVVVGLFPGLLVLLGTDVLPVHERERVELREEAVGLTALDLVQLALEEAFVRQLLHVLAMQDALERRRYLQPLVHLLVCWTSGQLVCDFSRVWDVPWPDFEIKLTHFRTSPSSREL